MWTFLGIASAVALIVLNFSALFFRATDAAGSTSRFGYFFGAMTLVLALITVSVAYYSEREAEEEKRRLEARLKDAISVEANRVRPSELELQIAIPHLVMAFDPERPETAPWGKAPYESPFSAESISLLITIQRGDHAESLRLEPTSLSKRVLDKRWDPLTGSATLNSHPTFSSVADFSAFRGSIPSDVSAKDFATAQFALILNDETMVFTAARFDVGAVGLDDFVMTSASGRRLKFGEDSLRYASQCSPTESCALLGYAIESTIFLNGQEICRFESVPLEHDSGRVNRRVELRSGPTYLIGID